MSTSQRISWLAVLVFSLYPVARVLWAIASWSEPPATAAIDIFLLHELPQFLALLVLGFATFVAGWSTRSLRGFGVAAIAVAIFVALSNTPLAVLLVPFVSSVSCAVALGVSGLALALLGKRSHRADVGANQEPQAFGAL